MQTKEDNEKLIFQETRLRSLVKAIVYRILSFAGTAVLTWIITKDIKESIALTLSIQAFLMILYYSSERVWNKIDWGRQSKRV